MEIRTKHFGASFEACLEGLKAMEIGENNVTKKVPVLVLKTYEKAGAQKWASSVQDSSRSCCWSNQLQLEINASTNLRQ